MKHINSLMFLVFVMFLGGALQAQPTGEQDKTRKFLNSIGWIHGPAKGDLGGYAEINVPADFVFANGKDTKRLLEFMHNPPSGTEVGFLAPASMEWFITFEFSPVGYVKDDDQNNLDAAALLEGIKRGTQAGNAIRRQRGWAELNIIGWYQPPKYNSATNNLEWAISGESDGSPVVNYNTRLLGRHGVMEVSLVGEPGLIPAVLPNYASILSDYKFNPGGRYAEFKVGDKVAEYGLVALVAGTAAAVASKTGLFSKFWGFIVLIALKFTKVLMLVMVGAAALLRRLFSKGKTATSETQG